MFRVGDPRAKNDLITRSKDFSARVAQAEKGWQQKMAPYRGRKVITFHQSWPNFAKYFGIEVAGYVEPKPGIPPSPSHLTEVISQMKAQHVKAVIAEPYHDRRIAEKVASATGAKVVEFSQFPGGIPGTDSYVKLIDTLISRLAAVLK